MGYRMYFATCKNPTLVFMCITCSNPCNIRVPFMFGKTKTALHDTHASVCAKMYHVCTFLCTFNQSWWVLPISSIKVKWKLEDGCLVVLPKVFMTHVDHLLFDSVKNGSAYKFRDPKKVSIT